MKRTVSALISAALAATHLSGKDHNPKQHPKAKPLSQNDVPNAAQFQCVVVDAGHGGHDLGGIPQNLMPEKDVALDIARRLSYAIEDAGLKAVLTRDDDIFVTLDDRVKIGNNTPNAIFVSIHFNAAPNKDAHGIETYYCKSAGGRDLATRIQQKLVTSLHSEDRGTKSADYYVLRKANNVAVLVECGFLTNEDEKERIIEEEYRQTVADQVCAAIMEYRNSLQSPFPSRLASR